VPVSSSLTAICRGSACGDGDDFAVASNPRPLYRKEGAGVRLEPEPLSAGVQFVEDEGGGPGVRLRAR
jgi:hypothetical protein